MQTTRPLFRGCKRWLGMTAACLVITGRVSAQTPSPAVPADSTPAVISASPTATMPMATPTGQARVLYPLNGAQSPSVATTRGNNEPPGIPGLATTFLMLLALCGAGYYLMRRQTGFAAMSKGPRKLVVSESRSLGNRQFLVVVEYESERILLGVTPGKIDYLCPLPMTTMPSEVASRT